MYRKLVSSSASDISVAAGSASTSPRQISRIKTRISGSAKRLVGVLAASFACALAATGLHAQTSFGAVALGSSSSQSVTVTAKTAGSVDSVKVFTAGSVNRDFTAGSSSGCETSLSAGQTCQLNVTFSPAATGQRLGAVVLFDDHDHILGTAYLAGTGTAGLAVLFPGNEITYAGVNGVYDQLNDGGLATQADLYLPSSIALDGAGNLYIADSDHNRIRVVNAKTHVITTLVGNDAAGFSPDGTDIEDAMLNRPAGLAIDGAGNLYIADTKNNAVRIIPSGSEQIYTVAGTGTAGNSGDGGSATAATLNQPMGVTADAAGNIYIADTGNHEIRKVDVSTGNISTVAGTGYTTASGDGDFAGDGGPATSARLNRPYAVAFDAAGNMYIPDSGNDRVRVVKTDGTIATFAGSTVNGSTSGFSGDGGPATSAQLWVPSGVLVDAAQNLYIADSQNSAIRKVYTSGKINTLIRNGAGKSLMGGRGTANALYSPKGLALDALGNLYVADQLNMVVRQIQANVSLVDFTSTAVRQYNKSDPKAQVLENNGNDVLALPTFTFTPDANSKVDNATTTCGTLASIAVDATCNIGTIFAPSVAGNPLLAAITVTGQTTQNSPLTVNLIGNAPAVNSTTTVLTVSPTPEAKFGQIVTLSAAVTTGPNTGALSGTVTFYDGATALQSGVVLNAAGVASMTTSSLTVGQHTLTAAYNEDGKDQLHTKSTSDPVTETVNEATAIALVSSANPSAVSASVTFTATVGISGGGGVTPAGSVTFYDGSTSIGVAPLSGATAAISTSTLADGPHSITAAFSPNAGIYVLGSTSAVLKQSVLAATTVVVTSDVNPSLYGTTVNFAATITSGASIRPSGALKIFDGVNQLGTATLDATTGVATFSTSSLATGSHTITANFPGDTNSGPFTSAPYTQTVNLIQTTTLIQASPTPGIAGKPVALTAIVHPASGSGVVTGTVTFKDGSTVLGTAKLAASGSATLSTTLAPGAHALTASFTGDTNAAASASSALAFNVALATTSVTLNSSASPVVVLSTITFTASVTGNGGTPTGTIAFSVDGNSAGSAVVDSTGKASITSASLGVGTHAVTATYSGDSNDNASTSTSLSQVVRAIDTLTHLGSSSTSGTAPQSILIATTSGSSGPTPTGTVTFSYGGSANTDKTIGSATLNSSGVATVTPDLPEGKFTVIATYSGDSLHSASVSPAVSISGTPTGFNISANPSTITMATSENKSVTVQIKSNSGFADTIGMGCLSLPAGVTCTFAHNNVALKAGQTLTVDLSIDTNSPLQGGKTASNAQPGTLALAGLGLPASLLFGFVFWRFRRRHAAMLTAALALFLAGAFALTGCGAGFSQRTAVPGTYTIQVGGIGTASNISHYQPVKLTITK